MAATVAGVFGITGILACIFLLVLAIARYFGFVIETRNIRRSMRHQPTALPSVAVGNPFTLDIEKIGPNKLSQKNDLIPVKITAQKTCKIQCFWNVDLCKVLSIANGRSDSISANKNRTSSDIIALLNQYSSGTGNEKLLYPTLDAGESFEFEAHTSEYRSAESPHTKLLIAISLAEEYDRKDLLDEDIVCLYTTIDAKFNKIDGKIEHFISRQLIQTEAKRMHDLKALYSSGVPDINDELNQHTPTTTTTTARDELCIICHSSPVTRALLPCRHACICGVCFKKTKLCPICRSQVLSFLITNDESRLPVPPPEEADLVQETSNRLNDMSIGQLIRAVWNAS